MNTGQLRQVISDTLTVHKVTYTQDDITAIVQGAEAAIPHGRAAILDAITNAIHARFPGLS